MYEKCVMELVRGVIHRGVESEEILAQRPQVGRGGPEGKISKLS